MTLKLRSAADSLGWLNSEGPLSVGPGEHPDTCGCERCEGIRADLNETHPDMRPCQHCGKPQREHSYVGDRCLPEFRYTPRVLVTGPGAEAMSLQGWECPKCGQVYGPFVQQCSNCVPRSTPSTTITPAVVCTCGLTGGTGICPLHGGQCI